ncbi:uncharacterized protein Z518_02801 [Rhinocladiella mackenziei CBS 650.93]|uniref:Major facilitator superfamily (MFS) profile domain-containing protein n=1 Tax=Rhinocladiella mackenziei CBS 650.93 TaxID=1442369 RepID=A0A0D2JFR4_9EURO|nr:uncharacterized protein Z518_02801 [Rhinocladiella mackenziei CBS 650.93]KIX08145.1 hypothetical protein Z518_02801 [Rhinocladiella mackenziei CBS 650.93]
MIMKDALSGEAAGSAIWHSYLPKSQDEIDREMRPTEFQLPADANKEVGNKLIHNSIRRRHKVLAPTIGAQKPYASIDTSPKYQKPGAASQLLDWRLKRADGRGPPTYVERTPLSIGTLVGALMAGPVANNAAIGRKYSICIWSVIFCVGVTVQIGARGPRWYEVMIGRIIAGLAIGGLSVMVPCVPGRIQPSTCPGSHCLLLPGTPSKSGLGFGECTTEPTVNAKLFIAIGILIANLVNFGTENIQSTASWRVPMGVGFLFALVLGFGILACPETPRHEYRHGKIDSATTSIAKFHGVSERHTVVRNQLMEMRKKLQIEIEGGSHPWYEALQQLAGANYFFYYSTTVFASVGLSNSYVTQIILGAVNVGTTFPGLYFVEKFGRRKCRMTGAAWMFMCFTIFASLGHLPCKMMTVATTRQSVMS